MKMDYDDDDSIDSILTEIDYSLGVTYPDTREDANQVLSAYHEDIKTVGYGRSDIDHCIFYNNPFDPRLTFDGLGEHIYHPDVKNEKHKAELTQNVFLALEQPSKFMDKYLNGYRSYVRGLSETSDGCEWSDNTSDCNRLYNRIASDSVKSIWCDTLGHGLETIEEDFSRYNQQTISEPSGNAGKCSKSDVDFDETNNKKDSCLPGTTLDNPPARQKMLNRHTLRPIREDVEPTISDTDALCEETYPIKESQKELLPTGLLTKKSWPSLGKPDTQETNGSSNIKRKEAVDSWAGLFKKPDDESLIEIERDQENADEGSTQHQNRTHNNQKQILIKTKECRAQTNPKNYTNSIHAQESKSSVSNQISNHGYQGARFPAQRIDQQEPYWRQPSCQYETYNNQPRQLWTDKSVNNQNQQYQLWSEQIDQQPHPTYQNQHIQPPPGFNHVQQHNYPSAVNGQSSYYHTGPLQQNTLYNNNQDLCDQQSLVYNLQRFVQPPETQTQTKVNRYQYYPSAQKAQYMYLGNWNANNNTEVNNENNYENKSRVKYSNKSIDATEEAPQREQKSKSKSSRQIRSNLIRIYPSKDMK